MDGDVRGNGIAYQAPWADVLAPVTEKPGHWLFPGATHACTRTHPCMERTSFMGSCGLRSLVPDGAQTTAPEYYVGARWRSAQHQNTQPNGTECSPPKAEKASMYPVVCLSRLVSVSALVRGFFCACANTRRDGEMACRAGFSRLRTRCFVFDLSLLAQTNRSGRSRTRIGETR